MSVKYTDRILVVDDDPNLLAAIRRQFRSDMRMPGMNGIQFLARASDLSPDTVRVMLTGNADLDTAMHAVNAGNIFRFLVKPCQKDTMEWAVDAAVKQYRLVVAERELLERTLKGSVELLTDILALVNPVAFSRTSRIRNYARQIAGRLRLSGVWQYELAALLSLTGCIALPPDTLSRFYTGETLSADEQELFAKHPKLGRNLLSKIPRLETIAEMIARQQSSFAALALSGDTLPEDSTVIGGLILKAAMDFDTLISLGHTQTQAFVELKKHQEEYHPLILEVLRSIEVVDVEVETKVVGIWDLNNLMVLAEDIRTRNDLLVAARGQQVTLSMLALLHNYIGRNEIKKEVRVFVPASTVKKRARDAQTAV